MYCRQILKHPLRAGWQAGGREQRGGNLDTALTTAGWRWSARRSIIVNLEHIKAIITVDKVLLVNYGHDEAGTKVVYCLGWSEFFYKCDQGDYQVLLVSYGHEEAE